MKTELYFVKGLFGEYEVSAFVKATDAIDATKQFQKIKPQVLEARRAKD